MCLSIPGKVIEIKKDEITVDYGKEKRKVNMSLVPDLKIGDYVLVSNKIIINKIEKQKVEEFMEMIK